MFPPDKRDTCLRIVTRIVWLMRWITIAPNGLQGSPRFTLFDFVKEGIFDVMPRKTNTSTPTNNKPISQGDAREKGRAVWTNVVLTEADLDILERDNSTPEIIGGMLLSVAVRGYGFSVKRMEDGQSYMCAIIGPHDTQVGRDCGVSAFAADPRDAILGCLYKFMEKLGGSFSGSLTDVAADRHRFR